LVAVDRTLPDAATMVDTDATTYHASRAAAGALLAGSPDADGLVWCSHQLHDTPSQDDVEADDVALCVLLVSRPHGTGVDRAELEALGPSIPFWLPGGMSRLDSIALDLDATVVRR
jgi:hypothetical protein